MLVCNRTLGGEISPARAKLENKTRRHVERCVCKTFHCDESVSIFLTSNTEMIEYTGGPPGSVRFIYH